MSLLIFSLLYLNMANTICDPPQSNLSDLLKTKIRLCHMPSPTPSTSSPPPLPHLLLLLSIFQWQTSSRGLQTRTSLEFLEIRLHVQNFSMVDSREVVGSVSGSLFSDSSCPWISHWSVSGFEYHKYECDQYYYDLIYDMKSSKK